MRARCVGNDSWVSAGKEYTVLGVYGRDVSFKYRLIGDDGLTPALHDAKLFELSSPQIPKDWIFKVYPNGEWEMTPTAWAVDGFWTAYFDGDPTSKEVFAQVLAELEE